MAAPIPNYRSPNPLEGRALHDCALPTDDIRSFHGTAKLGTADVSFVVQTTAASLEEVAEANVFIPGFGGTQTAYQPLAKQRAALGDTAVTFKPLRFHGGFNGLIQDIVNSEDLLPATTHAVMRHLYNRYGIAVFSLNPHSWGSYAATDLAENIGNPDHGMGIRAVRYIDAAGFTNHTLGSMACDIPALTKLSAETVEATFLHPELAFEAAGHNGVNIFRTAAELITASSCRIGGKKIEKIGELGIKTVGIFHAGDPLFPAGEAEKLVGDYFDDFRVGTKGWHLGPITHPEALSDDISASNRFLARQALSVVSTSSL
jgi:pimeloyl-ACP methyl ester carboxylesterase